MQSFMSIAAASNAMRAPLFTFGNKTGTAMTARQAGSERLPEALKKACAHLSCLARSPETFVLLVRLTQ